MYVHVYAYTAEAFWAQVYMYMYMVYNPVSHMRLLSLFVMSPNLKFTSIILSMFEGVVAKCNAH